MLHIAAIGEIFLDLLPTGVRLGGAPAGVAWYCAEMGAQGLVVSAIGNDQHGWRVQRELQERHLPADYVAQLDEQSTGEARIHYDENGKSSYHFLDDVAWDHIPYGAILEGLAAGIDAVVYTTMSQRAEESRQTVYSFLDKTAAHTLRFLDLHLFAPYYNDEILDQSFRRASVAKIRQSELPVIAQWLNISGASAEETARMLLGRYTGLRFVACTRGENGSILFDRVRAYECGGFYADQFMNSYGCSEAFSAVLCLGILNGADPSLINEEANRAACCVCSEPGALVPFSDEVLDNLQKARII